MHRMDGKERKGCAASGRGRGGGPRRMVAYAILPLLVALLTCTLIGCAPASAQQPPTGSGAPAQQTAQTAATPTPQRMYVAIGASDAFGIGTDDPQQQAWPVVLARTLGSSYRLIDLGIPGATVAIATRDELPIALDAQPAIITVWLAFNDFDTGVPLATYTSQLRILLQQLVSATQARIYVGNLPELALLPYYAHSDRAILESEVAAWNSAIATVCAQEGVMLVDLYTVWAELASHPEYISADGFHPSASGAVRLAALFATAIGLAGSPAGQAGQAGQAGAP